MTEAADVYASGELVGHLTRDKDATTTFRYADGYDGKPLTPHLPLVGASSYAAGALPPLFSNLLPEGRRLEALRQEVKTSADDELGLLLAVGNDLVGDLQVVDAGTHPVGSSAVEVDLDRLDQLTFADLRGRPTSGVPGVQSKVSARISLPVREAALSTHLLKFGQSDLRLLVANEHACLSLTRKARLKANVTRVVSDAQDEQALLVTRFDRALSPDGYVTAHPLIDGCQAANRFPADKYKIDAVDVINALAGLCVAPVPAALRLLEQAAFSYLLGNGDLHAKNLSVLDTGGGFSPSPVYDVTFTHPYNDTHTMALPLAGEDRVATISRATFIEAGSHCQLPAAAVITMIDRLIDRTATAPDTLAALPWPNDADKYRRVLENRRTRLAS